MARRFFNPYIRNTRRKSLHYLLWQLGYYEDVFPQTIAPEGFEYPVIRDLTCSSQPKLTWINHCTFLIEISNLVLITDPVWADRCSPIPGIGPKRQHPPAVALESLKRVDFVLISHNHYDHLDAFTVKKLCKKFPNIIWIVPIGLKQWFTKRGVHHVKELNWWDEVEITLGPSSPKVRFTAVPAQHNSGRGIFDQDKTLWMGIIAKMTDPVLGVKTLYFVGDTAYNSYDFKKIGERFPSIDLCLCPIGTYKPGRFMRTVHSSPEDAVNIHVDVSPKLSVGMHWKTFCLSSEGERQPPFDLYQELKRKQIDPAQFLAIEPGRVINW